MLPLAHMTPEVVPSFWMAFFAGALAGAMLVYGVWFRKTR